MPPLLVGGAAKLYRRGKEWEQSCHLPHLFLVWLPMGGDSLEHRGPVLFTALTAYMVPKPRRY